MCTRVNCPNCGRPTFAGCGAHVEQVLRGVAPADRCHCAEETARKPTQAGARGAMSSWLRDLLRPGPKAAD